MAYYKNNPIDFLKEFPASLIPVILGLDNSKDAKAKKDYKDAMDKYRTEYQKAVAMGITPKELKVLGIDWEPEVLSSSGKGGSVFGDIPIFVTGGANLPPPTRARIEEVERKVSIIIGEEEKKEDDGLTFEDVGIQDPDITEQNENEIQKAKDAVKALENYFEKEKQEEQGLISKEELDQYWDAVYDS